MGRRPQRNYIVITKKARDLLATVVMPNDDRALDEGESVIRKGVHEALGALRDKGVRGGDEMAIEPPHWISAWLKQKRRTLVSIHEVLETNND